MACNDLFACKLVKQDKKLVNFASVEFITSLTLIMKAKFHSDSWIGIFLPAKPFLRWILLFLEL